MRGVIELSTQQSHTSMLPFMSFEPQQGHASTGALSIAGFTGRSLTTGAITLSHFSQYQNGMGVPNTLCLEITQSHSSDSAQSTSRWNIYWGYQSISLAALITSSARSLTLMNHCGVGISSTGFWQLERSEWTNTLCSIVFCLVMAPIAFRSAIMCF